MAHSAIAKGPQGIIGINNHGESIQISDPAQVSEIEKLVAERQRSGREITKVLQRLGLNLFGCEDDPTEVIDNSV